MNLGPLIIGLSGPALSDADCERVAHPAVGGFILFTRNFEGKTQLAELVASIRRAGGAHKPIFVDHEGGRVQRFKRGFTAIPNMRLIGQRAKADFDDGIRLAREAGFVMAAELRACGIDMSFAPVLDLDWGNSEIIGNRSFSKDPKMVSRLAGAVMHGMALAGMQACGKHFPGHGWVKLDSHVALPEDTRKLNDILRDDALPYTFNTSLNMAAVMPAHVVYSQVDKVPACFSQVWLQEILRVKLGFDGAIISDDLDMVGAHALGDIHARCRAALQAGCDAVLVCNDFTNIDKLLTQPMPEFRKNAELRTRRLHRLLGSGPGFTWQSLRSSFHYQAAIEHLSQLQEP